MGGSLAVSFCINRIHLFKKRKILASDGEGTQSRRTASDSGKHLSRAGVEVSAGKFGGSEFVHCGGRVRMFDCVCVCLYGFDALRPAAARKNTMPLGWKFSTMRELGVKCAVGPERVCAIYAR